MVFDWEDLYREVGKPKPEPPKPVKAQTTRKKPEYGTITVGFVMILLGFAVYSIGGLLVVLVGFGLIIAGACGFSLRVERDPNTFWGYEPRAGWDPDRGGGI